LATLTGGNNQGAIAETIDVALSDLVAGDNTLEFVTLNVPQNYPPAVANVDLVLSVEEGVLSTGGGRCGLTQRLRRSAVDIASCTEQTLAASRAVMKPLRERSLRASTKMSNTRGRSGGRSVHGVLPSAPSTSWLLKKRRPETT